MWQVCAMRNTFSMLYSSSWHIVLCYYKKQIKAGGRWSTDINTNDQRRDRRTNLIKENILLWNNIILNRHSEPRGLKLRCIESQHPGCCSKEMRLYTRCPAAEIYCATIDLIALSYTMTLLSDDLVIVTLLLGYYYTALLRRSMASAALSSTGSFNAASRGRNLNEFCAWAWCRKGRFSVRSFSSCSRLSLTATACMLSRLFATTRWDTASADRIYSRPSSKF